MDSVNSAWFVTRPRRRPITQYSWRIAHIEPTYILTYGVLMGFPVYWGCLSRMQPRMLASRRSPPHDPHNPVILTFSQSQYKYFSHQHEKWLKYLYCDWVKISMTSEKPSKDWEGFSDAAGRKIFRFSFRRHRICLGRFFLDWEGFSLAGTRVPQFLRNVARIPSRKGLSLGLSNCSRPRGFRLFLFYFYYS